MNAGARQKSGRSAPFPSRRSGQASVETLLMMGVIAAFVIPILFMFFSASNQRVSQMEQVQARALAQELSDAAGRIWLSHNGSRMQMLVNFPQNLRNISLSGDLVNDSQLLDYGREITVSLRTYPYGSRDFVINSPAPVRSVPPLGDSERRLAVTAGSPLPTLRSGLVVLVLENEGGYVNIYRPSARGP